MEFSSALDMGSAFDLPILDTDTEFISEGLDQVAEGHLLTLVKYQRATVYWMNKKCPVCKNGFGRIPVFVCVECNFGLHIGCALPPTITSNHHRHPLTFADSYAEDDSGEYYCDDCEKPRHLTLPVYRCLECSASGRSYVAHFDCVFYENNLSIAHKLRDKASTFVIIDPAFTLQDILKSIADDKAAEPVDATYRDTKSEKVSIYSQEAFILFMEKYNSTTRDIRLVWEYLATNSQAANVGEYTISNFVFPLLKALFTEYGDFSVDSTLSSSEKKPIFVALCTVVYDICNTNDADITEDLLFTWWDCFRIAQLAGLNVHFTFDRFGKALHTYYGFQDSIYTECAISDLDECVTNPNLEVEALVEKHTQCIASVVANSRAECLSENLQIVGKFKTRNTWKEFDNCTFNQVGIYTGSFWSEDDIGDMWPGEVTTTLNEYPSKISEDSKLRLREQNEKLGLAEEPLSGVLNFGGKEKNMFVWDCHIVKKKIEAFVLQHISRRSLSSFAHKHRMTIYDEKNGGDEGEVHCSGCELPILERESPIYGCTLCNFFLHSSCAELPRLIYCILHDHKLNLQKFVDNSSLDLTDKNVSDEVFCFVCKLPIWGLAYHCTECNFFLHKLCVQLPLEIQHPLHPKHPLLLDLNADSVGTCIACGEKWRGCAYTCQRCKFSLEVGCIYLKPTIRSQSHFHLLNLIEEKSMCRSCTCSECGKNFPARSPFLYCMLCGIYFHVQCSFPSTITCSNHLHRLTLSDSYVEEDDSNEFYCDKCEKDRHANHPIYLCQECNFVAHISCESYEVC